MARPAFNYTQLALGDCGHVVQAWPQRTLFGKPGVRYICLECTAETYGLDVWESEGLAVWVYGSAMESGIDEDGEIVAKKKAKKPRKPRAPKPEWNPVTNPKRQDGLW